MTSTLVQPAAATRSVTRIPLTTFAIGFGLAGLAGAWNSASPALGLPCAVPQGFYAVAALAWIWLIVAHLVRGARAEERLIDQIRHPAQGPIASLAPVTAMLPAAQLHTYSHIAGWVLYLLALTASAALVVVVFGRGSRGGWSRRRCTRATCCRPSHRDSSAPTWPRSSETKVWPGDCSPPVRSSASS